MGAVLPFILASVALAAVAQLLLKHGVTEAGPLSVPGRGMAGTVVRVVTQPGVIGGLALFAVSATLWVVALSRAPLSFAYPFASLTYVLILLFDRFVLHQHIEPLRWAGVGLIIAGLVLVSRTGNGA